MARPALHVLLGVLFLGLFCWPILTGGPPRHVFRFLYLAWAAAIVVLAVVSRGQEAREDDEAEPAAGDNG